LDAHYHADRQPRRPASGTLKCAVYSTEKNVNFAGDRWVWAMMAGRDGALGSRGLLAIAGHDGFQGGVGMNYRDAIYGNAINTNSIPSYVLVNLVFAYKQPKWNAALGLTNITNDRYFVEANGAGALVSEPFSVFAATHVHF
jgi:hypothetical protein